MHKKKVVNKELHAIRRYAQQHEQLSGQTEHQTIYGGRYSNSSINRYRKEEANATTVWDETEKQLRYMIQQQQQQQQYERQKLEQMYELEMHQHKSVRQRQKKQQQQQCII